MTKFRHLYLGVTAACVCLAGGIQAHAQDPIFFTDFNSDNGGFTVMNGIGAGIPAGPWTYSAANGAWSADGGEGVVNSAIDSPVFTVLNDGGLALSFSHRYNFEDDGTTRWDGGQVRFSLNGGEFVPVIADAFITEGYATDRVIAGNSPPITNQFGFNNTSTGFGNGDFVQSVANLGTFSAGDELSIRFIGAWDDAFIQTPAPNWEIDEVSVIPSNDLPPLPEGREHRLVYQVFSDIAGGTVDDLRASPNFPGNPSIIEIVNLAEVPINQFDNYGTTLSGFFTPDESGLYDFYMSSDDGGELWLSTDTDPANKVLIAREPEWNGSRQYATTERRDPNSPENRSTNLFPDGLPLEAGQSYYVEALMKEAGGGDNLSFTAALRTDPATPGPIPAFPLGGSPACNCGGVDIGLLSLEPVVPGDFNFDGVLDIADIDELLYNGLGTANPIFDLNQDGTVDLADRDEWFIRAGAIPADFDFDNQVDAKDLNTLALSWTQTNLTSYAQGDTDGNGIGNASNLNLVGLHWRKGTAAAQAVPEPSALALLLLGLPGWMMVRRHRCQ